MVGSMRAIFLFAAMQAVHGVRIPSKGHHELRTPGAWNSTSFQEVQTEHDTGVQQQVQSIPCGNHRATNCAGCPQGHGAAWCNGDCHWVGGQCVHQAGEYGFIARACVNGSNILLKPRTSIAECKRLCDQRSDCKGFEYGRNYGGRGSYRPDDCQLSSSVDATGCDGSHYNTDFFVKTGKVCLHSYKKHDGGCVHASNLQMIHNSNLKECELRCSASSRCKAFEFGHNYGGSGYGRPNDCHLQSGTNSHGCNGFHYNFDLYLKEKTCHRIPSYSTHGEWVPLEALPPLGMTKTWTIGTSMTNGREVSNSVSIGLEKSVTSGFSAGPFKAESTFKMTMSLSMSVSIHSSRTDSSTNSTSKTFVPHRGANFLWQWLFTYAEGGLTIASTQTPSFAQTVNRATPPRCLPGYFEAEEKKAEEEAKNEQFGGAQHCVCLPDYVEEDDEGNRRCLKQNPDYIIIYRS